MSKNGMHDGQRNRLIRLGATAFFLAAKNDDTEMMRLLLAAGANPRIPSADGTTPLMVAAGLKLWNPGEDAGTVGGMETEMLEAVKICLENGNDVTSRNDDGETALHGVAYSGVIPVGKYLIEHGAKLDVKDSHGWSPLAVANGFSFTEFYKDQPEMAAFLRRE